MRGLGCRTGAAIHPALPRHKESFRSFPCHMGLLDMTHVICIRERPVAVAITGQYRPLQGTKPLFAVP